MPHEKNRRPPREHNKRKGKQKTQKEKETGKEKNPNGTGEHIQVQIKGFKIRKKGPMPPTPVQWKAYRDVYDAYNPSRSRTNEKEAHQLEKGWFVSPQWCSNRKGDPTWQLSQLVLLRENQSDKKRIYITCQSNSQRVY